MVSDKKTFAFYMTPLQRKILKIIAEEENRSMGYVLSTSIDKFLLPKAKVIMKEKREKLKINSEQPQAPNPPTENPEFL